MRLLSCHVLGGEGVSLVFRPGLQMGHLAQPALGVRIQILVFILEWPVFNHWAVPPVTPVYSTTILRSKIQFGAWCIEDTLCMWVDSFSNVLEAVRGPSWLEVNRTSLSSCEHLLRGQGNTQQWSRNGQKIWSSSYCTTQTGFSRN